MPTKQQLKKALATHKKDKAKCPAFSKMKKNELIKSANKLKIKVKLIPKKKLK